MKIITLIVVYIPHTQKSGVIRNYRLLNYFSHIELWRFHMRLYFTFCFMVSNKITVWKNGVTNYHHAMGHHASIQIYTLFFQIYLQHRFVCRQSHLLRPIVQSVCLMLAIFCGITRINDNMHHVTDVLAGTALGCVVAICIVSI